MTLNGCNYTYGQGTTVALDNSIISDELQHQLLREKVNALNTAYINCVADPNSSSCNDLEGLQRTLDDMQKCLQMNTNIYVNLTDPNSLRDKYYELNERRKNLDTKLQDIYATHNSIANERKQLNDSTAYASVLWTILATSIIYYVFVKL